MSKFPSEDVRMYPLLSAVCTAGISTAGVGNQVQKARYCGHGNISVVIMVRCGSASEASGVSATAAGSLDFSVLESTAATANGTVISGATLNLGVTTAGQLRGALMGVMRVTSDLATSTGLVINGSSYHPTTAGATAAPGAVMLARAINGGSTGQNKLPHYTAYADAGATNQMWIIGDDDMGTGLDIVMPAASATVAVKQVTLQGVIDIGSWKLSTNTPKWISIAATANGVSTAGQVTAYMVSYPTGGVGTPGKKVSCTT